MSRRIIFHQPFDLTRANAVRSTLGDSLLGESLEGEPVPQSVSFKDGESPVEQEKATSTSPNI